jgi:hypothetical protein
MGLEVFGHDVPIVSRAVSTPVASTTSKHTTNTTDRPMPGRHLDQQALLDAVVRLVQAEEWTEHQRDVVAELRTHEDPRLAEQAATLHTAIEDALEAFRRYRHLVAAAVAPPDGDRDG